MYYKYKKEDIEQIVKFLNLIPVSGLEGHKMMVLIEQLLNTAQPCDEELTEK